MLAQLSYSSHPAGAPERAQIAGLSVLRVQYDPAALFAKHRLRRWGKQLFRAGCRRVLVPEGFDGWEVLRRCGLRPVDPLEFLQAHAAPLTLAALERRGRAPERCAVALRALRTGRGLERAAWELCPRVRELCVSAPRGGEGLCRELQWEFGLAVRPDFEGVGAAVRFDRRTWDAGEQVLELFPEGNWPGAEEISLPGLDPAGCEPLRLYAALWEAGKISRNDLEFT